MAKVLYGYDKTMGKNAEGITEKLTYTDLDTISDWALESVTYCTAAKYLADSNGAFSRSAAATALGYTPRPLSSTIRDTVVWLKEKMGGKSQA